MHHCWHCQEKERNLNPLRSLFPAKKYIFLDFLAGSDFFSRARETPFLKGRVRACEADTVQPGNNGTAQKLNLSLTESGPHCNRHSPLSTYDNAGYE